MSSLLHRLARWAESDPHAEAQRYKKDGSWKVITTRQYMDRIFHLALFLESRGFKAGDVGCILSYNCPEWVHDDMAVLLLRGKSAGIYPNSTTEDIHYILNHTGASVLGVQNKTYFHKITHGGHEVPESLKLILAFDGDTAIHPKAVAIEAAIAEGKRLAQGKNLEDYLSKIDPKEGCFLIYTSGTTGHPKGALLSHDNFVFTADMVQRHWRLPVGEGTMFSFLPLCHVAEKLQTVAVAISYRYTVSYCTKFEHVAREITEVEPTLVLAVPRVWEKMMDGVLNKLKNAPPVKRRLAEWAMGVGKRVAEARYAGRLPAVTDLAQIAVADKLVLSKVRTAMGLGRSEALGSGAAALGSHVSRWFHCLGLEIMEDYGQTESTGVVTMTEPGVESSGTVGKPLPGMELRIAEDGEILSRGRHVFVGYYKNDEATREAKDADGWLHTGDLGEVDSRGMLRIKGRKKEVLKTSGGKMIAPLPIEEKLKAAPMISQVCLVGDNRKYISALVTLSEDALSALQSRGVSLSEDAIRDPETVSVIKRHVDELNHALASYEQIKKFTILSREFSIADGEMTATLKMKRNVVEKRFKHLIDHMYADGGHRD